MYLRTRNGRRLDNFPRVVLKVGCRDVFGLFSSRNPYVATQLECRRVNPQRPPNVAATRKYFHDYVAAN